jgi:glycine hydroxymethyltransferase
VEDFVQGFASATARRSPDAVESELVQLTAENRRIHDSQAVNLNPATNIMNPKAEVLLAQGLGSRPSLGYPGDKYEMGLEAIERIEIIAAELAAEVFDADYAEIRVASGAMANLYAFMAAAKPGDAVIVPPPEIGGHVTHQAPGAAGLYGLAIHAAPVDEARYTVDLNRLQTLARKVRPRLISIGGSLNLNPHPVKDIRRIADEVGAVVLYDAAHMSGMIAGKAWQQPLAEGAHLMTMSTYKSLGGPASGLILTHDRDLARRLEAIAFPGLTANFDVAKSAALAITLLDWKVHGAAYARAMADTAAALALSLAAEDLPVFKTESGFTCSHQFALKAQRYGGGQTVAKLLRRANILSCGIGLPIESGPGDLNGLRLGTPEIVRRGMGPEHMRELARLIARVLQGNEEPERVAGDVTAFRQQFQGLWFVRA